MDNTSVQRQREFAELYRSHLSAIAQYSTRRASPTDAVDVVAETFTIAWRRFDEMPSGSSALPWLYGVARRVLANQRRGTLRRNALHDRLCGEWTAAPTETVDSSDLDPLRRALHSLSDPDREILLLAGAEELRPAEIAVVLEVLPEVARNRLSRARARLRTAMDEASSGYAHPSSGHVTTHTEEGGQHG